MNFSFNDITAVTYSWMQVRMTIGAVRNFRKFYPDIPMLVIDNGTLDGDMSTFGAIYGPMDQELMLDRDMDKLRKASEELNFKLIELGENLGHGSATDYAVWEAKTPLLLTMDNDIRIVKHGLIEEYLRMMNEDPENIFAVGPTYRSTDLGKNWVGLWFSLWQLYPIKRYHLTFSNLVVSLPEEIRHLFPNGAVHLEPGLIIDEALKSKYGHRTNKKEWKSVIYPLIDKIPELVHLKVRDGDEEAKKKWLSLVDG